MPINTVVWDGAIAGVYFADNFVFPNPTAYSDGNGIITVTQATITMNKSRLEIRNCHTLIIPASGFLSVNQNSATEAGQIAIYGKETQPIVIRTVADVPDSWAGIVAVSTLPGAPPVVLEIYFAEIRGCGLGSVPAIWGTAAAGSEVYVRVENTKLHKSSNDLVRLVLGVQTMRGPSIVRACQLIGCQTDSADGNRNAFDLDGASAGCKAIVDHCSVLFRTKNSAGTQNTILLRDNVLLELTNNCIAQQNTDAGQVSKVVAITGTATLTNHHNFIHTYVEAQDLGALVLSTGDQAVDPGYFSSVCTAPDLRPTSLQGTPDLWQGSSIGWHVGALEPHDLVATLAGTAFAIAAEHTSSHYGEFKQRVYTGDFSTAEVKSTQGRGVRMRVTSRDSFGKKCIAGIWVESVPEGVD